MDQAQGLARKGICIWNAVIDQTSSHQKFDDCLVLPSLAPSLHWQRNVDLI